MNDRARVPFALVGVVLLVGSASLSASMAGRSPVAEPRTEAALEDARAATLTALRSATRSAAARSARSPVTAAANTTVGRALDGPEPFRAYLALRVYDRFADASGAVRGDDGVRVSVRVPDVSNATTLRRALGRTTVERAGPTGSALRVTVSNVTLVAMRDGRAVERVTLSPTVTVASPTLLFHDRTSQFARRLDRSPTRPGLGRRATARLYTLAWARGYAQYAGGPVANVVGNRHVSLAVNHALLAEQRAAFGRADRTARDGVNTLGARTLGTDLLRASGYGDRQASYLRDTVDDATPNSSLSPVDPAGREPPASPEDEFEVRADEAATATFREFVDGSLDRTLARTYSANVRLRTATESVSSTRRGTEQPDGAWTLVATDRTTRTTVVDGPGATVGAGPDSHVLASYGRRVTRRTVTQRRWRRGSRTTTTRAVAERTVDVGIAVVGTHAPVDDGQAAPIRGVHERGGGPLAGPNLAAVERRAVDRLVDGRGGVDDLARRAVDGGIETSPVSIDGERPDRLRSWVYRDLRDLRRTLSNVSVTAERGAVGTFAASPAADLASTIGERRASLVGSPARYDGVASRARHAARAAYVDAVVARLERRASESATVGERVDRRLAAHGTSLSTVRSAMSARTRTTTPEPTTLTGSTGPVTVVPDGAPPVLTLNAVDRRRIDVPGRGKYTGLAARNVNVFTSPHGDVADGVVAGLFGERRARLSVASQTLHAARRLPSAAETDRVASRRAALHDALAGAVRTRRGRLRTRLAAAGVGPSATARQALVADALSRWPTVSGEAIALANGSAADRVARLAARRYPGDFAGVEDRDRLRLGLRAAARDGSGVREAPVDEASAAVREAGREALREHAKTVAGDAIDAAGDRTRAKLERRVGRSVARVPAGLPVTPVPSHWFATTNLWVVRVRGAYARFSVGGRRDTPGRDLRYVRDGSTVRYDWDGDGTRERVGRSERVDVEVRTAVVVVVPPGGRGVGDVDGDADERSAGWNTART